ncbi:hypothetical protein JWJ90_06575 [Desulfobulbus rhabdoformis]|jgi:DnaJ-class molecular chaperone|uniref:hypothetical protein n=1 Tax=Desulfobulbus rhabdoformis TaxID=34032 RepID=UPI0019635492|nr:hypothetical protein [Desulfobulbus rhabdoformis]MBM9613954.1 hypothetical protein [Desulfobulbus rhabdoformis]
MAEEKKVCPTCGGSGEIGYFAGESRFFITQEECPNCCGIGYILEEEGEPSSSSPPAQESSDE